MGHGVSFIISDFFSLDGFEEAVKLLQSKQQQISLIHVLDEQEAAPSAADALRLIDAENGGTLDVFVDSHVIKAYQKALKNFQNDIRKFCEKRGAHYAFATPRDNMLKLITGF